MVQALSIEIDWIISGNAGIFSRNRIEAHGTYCMCRYVGKKEKCWDLFFDISQYTAYNKKMMKKVSLVAFSS